MINYYIPNRGKLNASKVSEVSPSDITPDFTDPFDCLIEISSDFISACTADFQNIEEKALAKFGKSMDADQVYFCKYDFPEETIEELAQWSNSNKKQAIKNFRKVPVGVFRHWVEKHKNNRPVIVLDGISQQNRKVRNFIKTNHIKSHIAFPVFNDQTCWGFVMVNWTKRQISDYPRELFYIEKFGKLLMSYHKKIEYETRIEEQNKMIEALNHQKTAYLASINHEVRTPLNAIIGFSQVLKDQLENNTLKEHCHIILQNGYDLLAIMDNIMELAMTERNNLQKDSEKICLIDFMSEIETIGNWLINNSGKKEKIQFKIVPKKKLKNRTVLSDKGKIKQVIINLLKNSIKFTDEGTITLDYREINTSKIEISITDTGIGISKNQQENIFNFFDRGENLHSEKYAGFGLGLAISSQIVHNMNGSLSVSSIPAKGSKFSLTIPCEYTDER